MSLKKSRTPRERLLRNIQETSFAVDEARLYLDTHPSDKKAQQYFDKYNDMRRKAIQEFEQYYGPMLTDNIEATKTGWTWIDPPFPWDEGEN